MVISKREDVSPETVATIFTLHKQGVSVREIERKTGVSKSSVSRLLQNNTAVGAPPVVEESTLQDGIRKALKKSPLSIADLADALDCSPKRIGAAVEEMRARGSMITLSEHGLYDITPAFAAAAGKAEVTAPKSGHGDGEWSHVFGAVSDQHLCNKHSRLDVLNAAYDEFERQGITIVYNSGNWIDGEARFNKTELITRPGMDSQLDYLIENYPQKPSIVTHYIAGDDHEGWYQQREGVEIGKYLQYRAEDQGRKDLKYLGYGEADINLRHGNGSAILRVVHPGGGSAYAISYTDQKRVESYQGGEKPHVELAGHYHKYNYGYPREVHTVQVGCMTDQSMFMRKKRLSAHVGFVVIRIKQDDKGAIARFQVEWTPFYDRGYYRKDF